MPVNPPLTIEFLERTVPSDDWAKVPVWVMDNVGNLRPARSAFYREDTDGHKVIVLSTAPATPVIR